MLAARLSVNNNFGVTLTELLFCLLILSILLSMGMPNLDNMVKNKQVDVSVKKLRQTIELARNAAITKNALVTLCRSRDGESCGGKWADGILVFTDYDADRELDDEDEVFRYTSFHDHDGSITWRAFQNRQYLQITPQGFTRYQNGNFTLCPRDNDVRFARQLIVNRTARIRFAQDSDGDGIREDSQGRPIRCS